MTGGEFMFDEQAFEERLALATAMAGQAAKKKDLATDISSELYGVQPHEQGEAESDRRDEFMDYVQIALIKIANPAEPITLARLDQIKSDTGYAERMAAGLSTIGFEISPEDIDRSSAKNSEFVLDTWLSQVEARAFAYELQTARSMATELNVPVAEMYANDELYIEVGRRTATIEGIVNQAKAEIESLSPVELANTIRQFFANLESNAPQLDGLASLMDGPELQKIATAQAAQFGELARQIAMYKIAQLWGSEGIANLTDEQLAIVHPKKQIFSGTLALLEPTRGRQAEGWEG